jgi:hypothetical protein
MRDMNTINVVLLLDCIQKHNRNKQPNITFLDLRAAYDTVDRLRLWEKLLGITDNKYTSIISVFENNFLKVIS